tara:strand:+ start:1617 stop:2168 length:552 start_codon:yes stop_codon:yes gene_type:complete
MQPDPDPRIVITDNALTLPAFEQINEFIHSQHFLWRWGNVLEYETADVNKYEINCSEGDNHQLYMDILNTNMGIYNTELIHMVTPVFEKVNVAAPIRVKVNCLTCSPSGKHITHGYHIDNPYKSSKTSILYLDDSNGYTEFQHNKQKVHSQPNRLVTFPTPLYHSGTSPTDQMRRMVINFNYF